MLPRLYVGRADVETWMAGDGSVATTSAARLHQAWCYSAPQVSVNVTVNVCDHKVSVRVYLSVYLFIEIVLNWKLLLWYRLLLITLTSNVVCFLTYILLCLDAKMIC